MRKIKRLPGLLRSRSAQGALITWLLASLCPVTALAQAPGGSLPAGEKPNDFPTLARVEYVFECLNENRGPRHEMVYKCVCAVDRVAEAVSYDRWVDLSTFFNAQPMAGERGAYVRERSDIQSQLKTYRELQLNARKACFIPTDPK